MQRLLSGLLLFSISFLTLSVASGQPLETPQPFAVTEHVRVELLADRNWAPKEGGKLNLGVHFVLQPEWHIYWMYPGDSGSAPKLSWTQHPLISFGQIQWPYPERLAIGPLLNYGYPVETLLVVPVQIQPGIETSLSFQVDLEWLVCKEDCIPGNANLVLSLPVKEGSPPPSPATPLFEKIQERWPLSLAGAVRAILDASRYRLTLRDISSSLGPLTFIPDSDGQIENAAAQQFAGDTLILQKAQSRDTPASVLSGLLVSYSKGKAFHFSAPVTTAQVSPGVDGHGLGIISAILFGFLGGLLLNLMPCVFPVLSIKALGLVQTARKERVAHAIFFSLGVIGSFVALAAAVLVLQRRGGSLGWGFQLQSPQFVAVLALIMTAMGLWFFGVFQAGSSLQTLAGKTKVTQGNIGAFLSGVLATVIATPCTAPFMGTALAYALTQPPLIACSVFLSLGVGMALPYAVLSCSPALLRFLPKPGAWMQTLKQLLAFPLFATVVWMLWVLSLQAGPGVVLSCLSDLLLLFFSLWLFNACTAPSRTRAVRIAGSLAALFGLGLAFVGAYSIRADNKPQQASPYHLPFEPWSSSRLAELRSQHKTVYVDFTAAWCITCQVNKKLVFGADEVRSEFVKRDVIILQADWTNKDDVILSALKSYGRQSVPLNLLFLPNRSDAVVLPSLLTPGMVLSALGREPR